MQVTAKQLLFAINNGSLGFYLPATQLGTLPYIELTIRREPFARLVILEDNAPRAWAEEGGLLMFVQASSNLRGGFQVVCKDDAEAMSIATAIDKCLKDGHKEKFGGSGLK